MTTRKLLRHLLGCLVLSASFKAGPAIAAGTLPQSLTWTGTTNDILALGKPFLLAATASSGLPVSLKVESGPAAIVDRKITVQGVGTVWVVAEQAGDATFAATRLSRSFNVRYATLKPAGGTDVAAISGLHNSGGFELEEGYAYLAGAYAGLEILKANDPSLVVRVAKYNTAGNPGGVHATKGRAYLADPFTGLWVFDVRQPDRPLLTGRWSSPGVEVRAVRVAGDYAYLVDYASLAGVQSGIRVLNVKNPANPVEVARIMTSGTAIGVQIVGNLAYVYGGVWGVQFYLSGWLQVIDVSDPTRPVLLGKYDTSGYASDLQVAGNYAYLADGGNGDGRFYVGGGLRVIDISNPAKLVQIGSYDKSGPASCLYLVGNYAYLGNADFGNGLRYEDNGLQVLDVSNPAAPIRVGGSVGGSPQAVRVAGSYAFSVDRGRFQAQKIDFGFPQTIAWQGTTNGILTPTTTHPLGATASSGLPVTLRVEAGPAVIADGTIKITGAGTVVVTADQAGNEDYLPCRETRSFNIRQASFSALGRYDTSGEAYGVQVVGDIAYVADFDRGLQVVDVSNPAEPLWAGGLVTQGLAQSIQVVGSVAYVVGGEKGMQVIDVSRPTDPVLLKRLGAEFGYGASTPVSRVQVVGDIAYVCTTGNVYPYSGLQVLDLSVLTKPVKLGSIYLGDTFGVQVRGDFAYVIGSAVGLQVVDISNPSSLVRLGGSLPISGANGMQVVGNYAYVSGNLGSNLEGLQVVDVRNPFNLNGVAVVNLTGGVSGVQVADGYAYVSAGTAGVQVIDVSDPVRPLIVGNYDTKGFAHGVQVVGNRVFVADGAAGLQILEVKLRYAQAIEPQFRYPQTLDFQLPAEVPINRPPPFSLVTADSGLPVALTVVSGPAVVTKNRPVWTGLGLVTFRAEQPGDDFFLPATAQWTVTITPPRLDARRIGAQLELSWSTGVTGLRLQGRLSLSPDSPWLDMTTIPVETGTEARLRLDESTPYRYFRLLQP